MRHFLHTWLRPSLLYALVALFVVWTMAPVVWFGTMSVQPEINYVSVPPHLSISDFSLRWYNEMLSEPDVASALRNSVITATLTMAVCLVFGSLAAYTLARLNMPRKNVLLGISVFSRMIPSMVLIMPMFLLMRAASLLDSYASLVTVYSAFLLPYVIWMLKNFFEQVPVALESRAVVLGGGIATELASPLEAGAIHLGFGPGGDFVIHRSAGGFHEEEAVHEGVVDGAGEAVLFDEFAVFMPSEGLLPFAARAAKVDEPRAIRFRADEPIIATQV